MPRYQGRCPDCRNLVWCVTAPRIFLEPTRGVGNIAARVNQRGDLLARELRHADVPFSYEFRAKAHECPDLAEQPLAVVLPFDQTRRRNRRKR